jgi:hypothetical protein
MGDFGGNGGAIGRTDCACHGRAGIGEMVSDAGAQVARARVVDPRFYDAGGDRMNG